MPSLVSWLSWHPSGFEELGGREIALFQSRPRLSSNPPPATRKWPTSLVQHSWQHRTCGGRTLDTGGVASSLRPPVDQSSAFLPTPSIHPSMEWQVGMIAPHCTGLFALPGSATVPTTRSRASPYTSWHASLTMSSPNVVFVDRGVGAAGTRAFPPPGEGDACHISESRHGKGMADCSLPSRVCPCTVDTSRTPKCRSVSVSQDRVATLVVYQGSASMASVSSSPSIRVCDPAVNQGSDREPESASLRDGMRSVQLVLRHCEHVLVQSYILLSPSQVHKADMLRNTVLQSFARLHDHAPCIPQPRDRPTQTMSRAPTSRLPTPIGPLGPRADRSCQSSNSIRDRLDDAWTPTLNKFSIP